MTPAPSRSLQITPDLLPCIGAPGSPLAHDLRAAHDLLDLVKLAAAFLDQLEADPCVPGWLRSTMDPLREAFAPWAPKPDAPAADWKGFMDLVVANLKASMVLAP